MSWIVLDSKQSSYYTNINVLFLAMGTIVVSFLVAIPTTLFIEAPYMNIEKYMLFPDLKKAQKANDSIVITKSNEKSQFVSTDDSLAYMYKGKFIA